MSLIRNYHRDIAVVSDKVWVVTIHAVTVRVGVQGVDAIDFGGGTVVTVAIENVCIIIDLQHY